MVWSLLGSAPAFCGLGERRGGDAANLQSTKYESRIKEYCNTSRPSTLENTNKLVEKPSVGRGMYLGYLLNLEATLSICLDRYSRYCT